MRIGRKETCVACDGTGIEGDRNKSPLVGCPRCQGMGTLLVVWFGLRCVPLADLVVSSARRAEVGL